MGLLQSITFIQSAPSQVTSSHVDKRGLVIQHSVRSNQGLGQAGLPPTANAPDSASQAKKQINARTRGLDLVHCTKPVLQRVPDHIF